MFYVSFLKLVFYRGITVIFVHEFFTNLNFIINVVGGSCKHHYELQTSQATQIAYIRATSELETGK